MIQISLPAAVVSLGNDPTKGLSSFKLTDPSTCIKGGICIFENDNYIIRCNDDNEITIESRRDGKSIHVWGDPHVAVNNQHVFDFWGTTTFNLLDGTKVTIKTTPWEVNPEMRLVTSVVITDGDYGVEITGVDSNTRDDLRFREYRQQGEQLDELVDDGNVLYENNELTAFFAIDSLGNVIIANQDYINNTDMTHALEIVNRYRYYFCYSQALDNVTLRGQFFALASTRLSEQVASYVSRRRTLVVRKPVEIRNQPQRHALEGSHKDAVKHGQMPLKLRIERYNTRSLDVYQIP
jgi:Domain of Unknown Function (DUF1521)